ncbi:MAG: bifunctional folylpolyglutamate synthase/dihydrofolate synthase [Candidatus Omnitrophica bacterium]|nr:bifunctional folylpolyglutamate synthase/dihydrofolate synthase [Candidatus Omnitrophota bacterium]MCM8827918.1 bifunctional folylpolyglutamate synthase/dihydrofolate synthase [Candidatus Omnitrophota bacterium]
MSGSGHKYLEKLTDFGIKLGLDKMRFILSSIKNPHKKYRSILIAGTNGKGSVACFISNCLRQAGYKVGLYTSPHLIRVEERIQINGKQVSSGVFNEMCLELKKLCDKLPVEMQPTYFEALTVIAFEYFKREKIDVCVCEVGMGGRFDATNVLEPVLEIIMPVSYDHMEYLGNSIEEIASEKAGIIKNNSIVVSGRQLPESLKVIKRVCRQKNAKGYFYGKDFSARLIFSDFPHEHKLNFTGISSIKNISIRLFGSHQIHNAAVAIQSLLLLRKSGFDISDSAIIEGMKKSIWPARFQPVMENPLVIIDGGHNPDGINSLKRALKQYFPDTKFIFLVGILKDKKWEVMLRMLSKLGEKFIFTTPDNPRSVPPEHLAGKMHELTKKTGVEVIENVQHAFKRLIEIKGSSPRVICGSLYLAGDILRICKAKKITF